MSAWHWLKAQLAERLGDQEAEALWTEYRTRARDDAAAAQVREQRRRARQGNRRAQAWLEARGLGEEGGDQ